jgi:anaerobic magnesium-protoporphyrin IX monomethyl ester cyclase
MKNKFKVLLVYPNLPLMLVPPLAIAIFTNILRKEGYTLSLFDTTPYLDEINTSPRNRIKYLQAREFDEEADMGVTIKKGLIKDYSNKVNDFRPNLIIYCAVVEDSFLKAISMMESIADQNIPNIIGGIFPTLAPNKVLTFDCVDAVGYGEGEEIIREYADRVKNSKAITDCPGIMYKDDYGVIHKNPHPPLVNINKSIPDFSLFDQRRFYRPMGGSIFKTFPIETYRGCPYTCTYCNSPNQKLSARNEIKTSINENHVYKSFLRRKEMDILSAEIDKVIEDEKPEFIYFIDDAFLARPQKEIFDFCDMYEKYKLPFWFNTRPENCTKENLKRLKEVGCYRISFGIECGNESYRTNVLTRKGTNDDIRKWFNIIAESGIPFSVNLIIGFPGETRENVFETIDLVKSIQGYDTLTVSIFTPYNGTNLRDVAVKNGWLDEDTITVHTTSSSLLKMPAPYLSSSDIDALMRTLPLYVFFDKKEWSNIKRAEMLDKKGKSLYKKYSQRYMVEFLYLPLEIKSGLHIEGTTGCKGDPKNDISLLQNH